MPAAPAVLIAGPPTLRSGQSLFVQARGGLQRELVKHLRTGLSMRKPRRREGERRGQIPGMVNISERPAEVEDRAVAGHWTDSTGRRNTSIVEALNGVGQSTAAAGTGLPG
ncbi:hypothetical protein CLV37_1341, partial [Kineococcus rhizosphaerae]